MTCRRLSPLALALILTSACAAESPPQQTLRIGPHRLQVEVAATQAQRERGLMGRHRLPENGGMLFVFDDEGQHCFWMRNTPLPLSIAFIDATGHIARLADMQPNSEALHCPETAVRYALEVMQGGFLERDIGVGAQVNGLP